MSKRQSVSKAEQAQALEYILETVKPGDTIYTILRHVSASGMSRVIDLKVVLPDGSIGQIGWNAARAMGMKYDTNKEGIRIGGAGMDMGFALVYDLAATLWPNGYECPGETCRSNDHSNGDRDRDRSPHHHRDGGYALAHRWL